MTATNFVRVNMALSSASGLPTEEITVGKLAKQRNYSTALIGKWHLGLHCSGFGDYCRHPLKMGFDYYFGLPLTNMRDYDDRETPTVHARLPKLDLLIFSVSVGGLVLLLTLLKFRIIGKRGFFIRLSLFVSIPFIISWYSHNLKQMNGVVMRNYEVVEQPIQMEGFTSRLLKEGVGFLEARKDDQKPFLLIMSWIQVHTALHASKPFRGGSRHGRYGDEVEELDWSVGEILGTLERSGLAKSTFVYFTSDHGGHLEEKGHDGNQEGGWNGIYSGGKGQGGMDGGIRVPTVARWPGVIPSGTVVTVPTSTMDVFATMTAILDVSLPEGLIVDGRDIRNQLRGDKSVVPHEYLFHYCGTVIHAVRYAPERGDKVWKARYATPNWRPGTQRCDFMCDCYDGSVTWHDPPLLFEMESDPSEIRPIEVFENSLYEGIMRNITGAKDDHEQVLKKTKVESQFSLSKLLPRPWFQPCCNPPFCRCSENIKSTETIATIE